MRTLTARARRSEPVPWQLWHGLSMMRPRPEHVVHGDEKPNRPWLSLTTPAPPHVGHGRGFEPGSAPTPAHTEHGASLVMFTVVVTPCTASSNDRWSSASRSAPRCGPVPRDVRALAPPAPRPPRPNSPPKLSPRPPRSPTRNVPPPGPPNPLMPDLRTSSYSLRRSASPSTS